MKALVLAGAIAALAVSVVRPSKACEECQLRKSGFYIGQFTLMGNGTVRSWVKYGENGRPSSLGITFSENALTGLREQLPAGMPMFEYKLALPKEAKATGFDHVSLDWNPKGHAPNGVYNVPHFDVHFYRMSLQDREQIKAVGANLAICRKAPGAQFLPVGYVMPPDTVVPLMGAHAIDVASPELHGQPFTSTFIYGYYSGKMIFVEPMITLDYLRSKPTLSVPVKVPTSYAERGYYPTRYSISFDPIRQEYTVALNDLTLRNATPQQSQQTPQLQKASVRQVSLQKR